MRPHEREKEMEKRESQISKIPRKDFREYVKTVLEKGNWFALELAMRPFLATLVALHLTPVSE